MHQTLCKHMAMFRFRYQVVLFCFSKYSSAGTLMKTSAVFVSITADIRCSGRLEVLGSTYGVFSIVLRSDDYFKYPAWMW